MVKSTSSEPEGTIEMEKKTENGKSTPPPPLSSDKNGNGENEVKIIPLPSLSTNEKEDDGKKVNQKPKAPPKPAKKPILTLPSGNSTKINSVIYPGPQSGNSSPAALLSNTSEVDEESLKLYPNRRSNFPLIVNSRPNSTDMYSSIPIPIPIPVPMAESSTSPMSTLNSKSNVNYSHINNYYNTNGVPISLNGTISSRGTISPTHLPYNSYNQQLSRHPHPHPLSNQSNGHNPSTTTAIAQSNHEARHNIRRPLHHSQPSTANTTTISPIPVPTQGNRSHRDYQRLHRVGFLRGKARTDSYKVISFICGFFAAILLVMGLSSTEWLQAQGYRQGLFVYCVGKNETDSTVPFVTKPELASEGCHRIDLSVQGYTLVAAAFCVVSLLVDVFATMLTVMGLRCRDPNKKYKYYRIAVYVMALALVTVLVALVVYPVCFAQIMDGSKRPFWEFGWAYGVGWGASIFLFGGVILLLCDKESEEIYYKERTIVYADTNNKV